MTEERGAKKARLLRYFVSGVLLLIVLIAIRWYIAEQRAASIGEAVNATLNVKSGAPDKSVNVASDNTNAALYSVKSESSTARVAREELLARALPSRGLPLANVAVELQTLSNDGNYLASCRLAMEIMNCELGTASFRNNILQLRDFAKDDSIHAEQRASLSAEIDRRTAELRGMEQKCAGFAQSTTQRPWELLLIASLHGHLPSIETYFAASGVATEMFNPIGDAGLMDAAAAYRQYAPQLLEHAASRGHPGATYMLAEEHAGSGLLSVIPVLSQFQLVPKDPRRAYMYAYAHEQASILREGKPSGMSVLMERIAKDLDANGIEAAKNDAETMMMSWGSEALQPQTRLPNQVSDAADICYPR